MTKWLTVGLLAVIGLADAATKPVAVLMGFSNDDPEIAKVFRRRSERLKACGYDVRTVEPSSKEQLETRLQAEKLPPGTVFLGDGHGSMFSRSGQRAKVEDEGEINPTYRFRFTDERGNPRTSGQDVIAAVKQAATAPQLWVDACYSGGCRYCRAEGIGLGMVCTERQQSFNDATNTDHLIDLMCSGVGDCRLWRQADGNGNGVLTGSEIEAFIDDKLKLKRKTEKLLRNERALLGANDREAIQRFQSDCEGGTVTEEKLGFRYVVKCTRKHGASGRTSLHETSIEDMHMMTGASVNDIKEHFADEASAEAHMKRFFPKWPDAGTERLTVSGKTVLVTYTDCKLERKPAHAWLLLTCAIAFPTTVTDTRHQSRPTAMAPVSLGHTFSLRAASCAIQRNRTGLQLREGDHLIEVK